MSASANAAPAAGGGEKKLSLFQQLSYSTGQISSLLINQIIVTWAIYFYAPGANGHGAAEGATSSAIVYAPIVILGYAMAFGRIIDAIADPLIGYMSDRTQTKWGRRIPYVVIGTPFLVAFFILFWRPPVEGMSATNSIYFALMLGGFFFFYTVVVAPYLSLMPEIAKTDDQRMSVSTWLGVFMIIGLLIANVAAPVLIGDDSQFMKMAIVMGAVSFFFFYFSIAFVRETPKPADQKETFSFKEAMIKTFSNKPFVAWVVCIFMFWIGFNVVMMATPYIVTSVMGKPEKDTAIYLGITMVGAIPCFIGVFIASKKFSKKILTAFAMLMLSAVTPMMYFIRQVPEQYTQIYSLAIFGLLAAPVAVLTVMSNAIIADIVDIDEKETGRRREAMFFGMQGLVTKSAIAISAVIGTQLMSRYGMTFETPQGILLTGPFCAIFTLIGFFAILKYPLDK